MVKLPLSIDGRTDTARRSAMRSPIVVMLAFLVMFLESAWLMVAQDRAAGNQRDGDAAAVAVGAGLFRERCAECHGADAKGVAGHDLTGLWAAGATDERVLQTIRSGVPGTLMPSSSAPDGELFALLSYLRSLNTTVSSETTRGNAEHGEQVFWSTCGSCHRVNGRGGPLGPDLSRIGTSQSRDQLIRAIRQPSPTLAAGYQAVTLVTRDGQRIRGTKKSEDAFSIQIMDTREQLQGYLKSNLREVVRDTSPLMPVVGPDKLNERDLDDLLQYLNTLRAAAPGRGRGRGRGN